MLAHVTCCLSVEHVLSMIVKRSPACLAPSSASRYGVPRPPSFLAPPGLFPSYFWMKVERLKRVMSNALRNKLLVCLYNVCETEWFGEKWYFSGQFKCEFKFRILNDAIRKIDVERTNLWSSGVWLAGVAQVF